MSVEIPGFLPVQTSSCCPALHLACAYAKGSLCARPQGKTFLPWPREEGGCGPALVWQSCHSPGCMPTPAPEASLSPLAPVPSAFLAPGHGFLTELVRARLLGLELGPLLPVKDRWQKACRGHTPSVASLSHWIMTAENRNGGMCQKNRGNKQ